VLGLPVFMSHDFFRQRFGFFEQPINPPFGGKVIARADGGHDIRERAITEGYERPVRFVELNRTVQIGNPRLTHQNALTNKQCVVSASTNAATKYRRRLPN